MKSNRVLIAIVAAATVLATQMLLPLLQQEAAAQNATTTTTNQTAGNQTQGAAAATRAVMGNLTQADFGPVTDSLNTARESLQTNDTTAAYDAVNSVDSELFGLANDQGEQNMKALMQQFKPLQDSIDGTRDALTNNDTVKALQQLDTADVELLKITQKLPSGEEEGEEE
jgi:hypothetical protein